MAIGPQKQKMGKKYFGPLDRSKSTANWQFRRGLCLPMQHSAVSGAAQFNAGAGPDGRHFRNSGATRWERKKTAVLRNSGQDKIPILAAVLSKTTSTHERPGWSGNRQRRGQSAFGVASRNQTGTQEQFNAHVNKCINKPRLCTKTQITCQRGPQTQPPGAL